MQELFFLHLHAAGDRAAWLDANGDVIEATLADAAVHAAGRRALVFVPTADVVFRRVTVPTRNRARIAAAVPYLLEDQLAADVDDLHFAVGERGADGSVAVAIVARTRMDAWFAALHEVGIQPQVLVPDCLALPYQQGAWTLWWASDNAVIRNGLQSGFALDADNVPFVLKRALAEMEPPPEMLWVMDAGGAGGEAAVRLTDMNVPLQSQLEERPALAVLKENYNEQHAINLLQASYSRREQLGRMWRPWWPVVALLLVWVAAQFGIKIYEYRNLDQQNAQLQEEINQVYLAAFPDAKRVVNARAQMEQRLTALRGSGGQGGDFMTLMAAIAQPVVTTPGLEVQRLAYKEGELNLALLIGDLQSLEQFKQRLAGSAQLNVEVQSATARNDRVEAEVHIKKGAS